MCWHHSTVYEVLSTHRLPQEFLINALPTARLLLVLGRGVCVRARHEAPGAPKELASLSLEQLGQLGIVPSGSGTGMRLSGGARPPCVHIVRRGDGQGDRSACSDVLVLVWEFCHSLTQL